MIPCTSIHVHSKLQSMIACGNICIIISISQVRNDRGWWRKILLILFVCSLRRPIKTISCMKIRLYFPLPIFFAPKIT